MRSTKLNFSATVITLHLKRKIFGNVTLYEANFFGGNRARAPRLTAVCSSNAAKIYQN